MSRLPLLYPDARQLCGARFRRVLHALPLALTAWALSTSGALAEPASPRNLPVEKTLQGVTYLSGGISLEESEAMQAVAPDYPLAIEVFEKAGQKNEYTASAVLTIRQAGGNTVLDAQTSGPYTLVRLPAGRYEVQTLYQGQTQKRTVQLRDGKPTTATFVFPGRPDQMAVHPTRD